MFEVDGGRPGFHGRLIRCMIGKKCTIERAKHSSPSVRPPDAGFCFGPSLVLSRTGKGCSSGCVLYHLRNVGRASSARCMSKYCWFSALRRTLRLAAVTQWAHLVLVTCQPSSMEFAVPDVVMFASTRALDHLLLSIQPPTTIYFSCYVVLHFRLNYVDK